METLQKKSKRDLVDMTTVNFSIYAIHPIMYQTPIFSELQKLLEKKYNHIDLEVLFGDDLSLREVFFKETQVFFKPDTPKMLSGYQHKFLKNLTIDSRSGFFSRVNLQLFSQLFSGKIDILLVHGYDNFTSLASVFIAKMMRRKIIWRGEVVMRAQKNKTRQFLKSIFLKYYFTLCDAVMYSCSGNKNYLESYGVEKDKLFFIPCAVDNHFFTSQYNELSKQRRPLREKHGIAESDFVIIFCARFTERKRPLDLIQALQKINRRHITVLFVGNGPEINNMKEAMANCSSKAIFVGFKNQSEISEYYTIADAAVIISSYDPSPKAMNEAMNFNLPIVATDVIGTAVDLIKEKKNGFLVQVGDITAIAESLCYLHDNKETRKKMGIASGKIVKEWNFTRDAEGIVHALNSVIK